MNNGRSTTKLRRSGTCDNDYGAGEVRNVLNSLTGELRRQDFKTQLCNNGLVPCNETISDLADHLWDKHKPRIWVCMAEN